MSAPKHTPGPWRADGEVWNKVIWSGADNRVCFMAHSNGLDDERDEASAHLIAAAPDLLAALEACVASLNAYRSRSKKIAFGVALQADEAEKTARAAIARAKGGAA